MAKRKKRARAPALTTTLQQIMDLSPIKIGAEYYRIKLFSLKRWPCGKEHQGCIHFTEREIHIKLSGSDLVTVDCLFHECLHGIKADRVSEADDKEEMFVIAIEAGLAALFCDNPGLLKLMTKYWKPSTRKRKETLK